MFRLLFERSADAISLFDPETGRFIESNEAVARQVGAPSKEALAQTSPAEISPERQPDGRLSGEKAAEMVQQALAKGSHRFDWLVRRFDGSELPLDIVMTAMPIGGRTLLSVVSRDISAQKQAEQEIRRLNASLEQRVAGRTAELLQANAQLKDEIAERRRQQDLEHYRSEQMQRHRDVLLKLAQARMPDFHAALETICACAATTLDVAHVSYWTLTDHDSALVCEQLYLRATHSTDPSAKGRRLTAADCPEYFAALATRRPIVADDVLTHPATRCLADRLLKPLGITSMLDAPVWVRGEVVGVLCHQHKGPPRRWSAEELAFLSALAAMVSLALEEAHRACSERRLRESEAKFRALVEHAPEAIVVFDGQTGCFLFGNEHACRLYGVTAEVLSRLCPADVSPEFQPDGRRSADAARQKMDEALAGGTPVFEWIHCQPSGRLMPTEVRLVRLPAEGQPLLRASIIDNTERKRREAIQQATFQISEAVHTADDLPSFYARIHAIVQTLMPARNFYIALCTPATGMIDFPYFVSESEPHPQPFPLGKGLTSHVLRTGKSLLIGPEMNARKRRVGDEVTFQGFPDLHYVETGTPAAIWLGVPLSLGGQALGVMAVQDYKDPRAYGDNEQRILTFVAEQTALALERKRAEQALRESEEKFRALFTSSSQGVMLHDENQYLEVNPAAVRILGYRSQEDLIGKHPCATSPPLQPNGERTDVVASRHIAECLARGSARFDWVGRSAQGREVPLEVTLTRIQWSGRQIIQACVSDISERLRAEAELRNTLAREKELGQLKSNFVSMVSHEFRTPLGIIQSSAEILRDYLDQLEPAERQAQLLSIVKNTRRMADMMEEVLVLSRLDAGKMEFKPAPVALPAFCRRVVDEVLSATDRRCPIELSLSPLPAEARADEPLLSHIFTNLLSNAVKYSEPGRPVQFRVERHRAEAICVIRDRGIGISPADQQELFKAFHRGANAADRPGTGLGLVLVKRCVELHGGTVEVQSALGEGTTVTVRLPLFDGAVLPGTNTPGPINPALHLL